jgi:hypothetical protein
VIETSWSVAGRASANRALNSSRPYVLTPSRL